MDSSDERVLIALAIEVYFAANCVMMFALPSLFGNYIVLYGDVPGYGHGIFSTIAFWDLCVEIYKIWTYCILSLPIYAIIQAAPEGAFSFIFNRGTKMTIETIKKIRDELVNEKKNKRAFEPKIQKTMKFKRK